MRTHVIRCLAVGVYLIPGLGLATDGETAEPQPDPASIKVEPGSEAVELDPPEPAEQLADPRQVLKRYEPFESLPRIPALEDSGYFPCTDCHDNESQAVNPTVRELEDEHSDLVLVHGGGRYWCLTCHDPEDRDSLRSLKGHKISFDEPYLLCGQCHFQRQRDFFNGAHGRRVDNWKGKKTLTPCPVCHNPHDPALKPRKPFRAPKARRGLELDLRPRHHKRAWTRAKSPGHKDVDGGKGHH